MSEPSLGRDIGPIAKPKKNKKNLNFMTAVLSLRIVSLLAVIWTDSSTWIFNLNALQSKRIHPNAVN